MKRIISITSIILTLTVLAIPFSALTGAAEYAEDLRRIAVKIEAFGRTNPHLGRVGLANSSIPRQDSGVNTVGGLSTKLLNGQESSLMTFMAPKEPDDYTLRLLTSGNNGRQVASVAFRIEPQAQQSALRLLQKSRSTTDVHPISWSETVDDLASRHWWTGRRMTLRCSPNPARQYQRVVGTDVYTGSSTICSAAVHAGVITFASGGVVTIEIRPYQHSSASVRNGVPSLERNPDYFFPRSFVFVTGVVSPRQVVYREPLPKTIWGVIDLSVDNLPEWAPPHILSATHPRAASFGGAKARNVRYLFVYGHGLRTSGEPTITSDDPLLEYTVLETKADRHDFSPPDKDSMCEPLWRLGWMWVMTRSPMDDADFVGSLEGMVLRVTMKDGALKSMKGFTLDGLRAAWPLTKSWATATPIFVRPFGRDFEWSDTFYIPDRFCVEVSTTHPLALAEIPVVITRNEQAVSFGAEGAVLIAKKVGPQLYRTGLVQTFRANAPPSTFAPGVSYTYFNPGDTVAATVRHTIGIKQTTTAEAKVWLTTAQVGAYWKDALYYALRHSNHPIDRNWGDVVPKEAMELVMVGGGRTPAGISPRPTGLTVGDHAAMILMRRMFIEMLNEHIAGYERLLTTEGITAAPSVIRALPEDHPLAVTPAGTFNGAPTSFEVRTVILSYDRHPLDAAEIARRQQGVARYAIDRYLPQLREALQKAEAVKEDDIWGLLKLTGFGFGKVEQRLYGRLMTISNNDGTPRAMWAPEIHARQHVQGLGYVAQKIKGDEEVAAAERQLILSVASLFPVFMAPATLFRVGMSAALAVADVVDLGIDGWQQYQNWQEFKFSKAAAEILDGERVTRAEMEKPGLWGNLAATLGTILGLKFDIDETVDVVRAGLRGRLPQLAAKVKVAGDAADTFRKLDPDEQADLLVAAAQVAKKKASGQPLTPPEVDLDELRKQVLGDGDDLATVGRPRKTPEGQDITAPHAFHPQVIPPGNVVHAVKQVPPTFPEPKSKWNGIQLGECISDSSAHFMVYEAWDEATKSFSKVIKISKEGGAEGAAVVARTVRGADVLRQAQMPHAEIRAADVFQDASPPYFLQDRVVVGPKLHYIPSSSAKGILKNGPTPEMLAKGLSKEAVADAFVGLYSKLAKKGIVWYDGHMDNMYFAKLDNGTWEARILDSDYLHRLDQPPLDKQLAEVISDIEWLGHKLKGKISSMAGAKKPPSMLAQLGAQPDQANRLYKDPELFMAKMLEYWGLISYNRTTKQWTGNFLDLDLVEKHFPGFRQKVDVDFSGSLQPRQAEVPIQHALFPVLAALREAAASLAPAAFHPRPRLAFG